MSEISEAESEWYRVLGVRPDASVEEVRRAFRTQAMRHHPDRNPGNTAADERFREIHRAYQIALRSIDRRAERSGPGDWSAAGPPVRPRHAAVRRFVRRSMTSANRLLGRLLLFVAFIAAPMLLILYVVWANTRTDWIPGCCWDLLN